MTTIPLRYLAEINPQTPELEAVTADTPVMFLPLETVWADGRADQTRTVPKSAVTSGYTRFRPGDVVCPKVTPTFQAGRSMIAQALGAGTTELHILRPRQDVDPRWVCYAVRSKHFLDEGVTAFQGVAGLQRVPAEYVASFRVADVSVDEQRRIADFLDDRVARIDQIITARSRQAVAVKNAHRSEVAELVTDGNGQWLEGSVRRFLVSEDGRRIPLSTEERSMRQGPYPYYGASGVIDRVDDYLFEGPRVLLSEDGANLLMRSSPIAFVADGKYWVNNHAHILRAPDDAYAFWAARLEALDVSPWVSGSAQPKLTIDAAMSLPVSAPAEPVARRELGQEIGRSAADANRRVAALQRSIRLLAEHKQSLITAAVSGELDVSTAGSRIQG